MKFWIGLFLGAGIASAMTAQQRRRTAALVTSAASTLRDTQVVDAVAGGVSDIAGAAGERASAIVSNATDAVTSTVEPS